jgi:hypothetical protein
MLKRAIVATLVLTAGLSLAEEKPRPPQAPLGTVTLPLGEYDRLVVRAARPPKRPEPPPLASVLSRADLKLRVTGEGARGSFSLDGEVFRSGATRVTLLSGSTVLDARREGKTLPLVSESGTQAAILTGPGPFSVTLDWGGPVVSEPGRASFVVPVPPAGSVRASLEVLGEQAEVRVDPGLITKRTAAAGKTLVEATLPPGRAARFSWSARDTATTAAPREVRFLSDVKTLLTVGEADLQMAVLVEATVLDGEPPSFDLQIPPGFEVTGASGATLDATSERPGALALAVREPASRRHQFLVGLARSTQDGSYPTDAPVAWVEGAQRETGEVAVEGVGTLELTATESGTLRRMDSSEASSSLRSLGKDPILAAFRYHRRVGEGPGLRLDVKRFPSASVLAAVAERAAVTTLATTEGRRLTEVTLTVRNHAQPFLKLALPGGSTLVSAEVAGETAKPVQGEDGTRVPLLRAGFKPNGPYAVSFVYLEPGTPFAKKGEAEMRLPRLDIPITLLTWELFLPDRYRVKKFEGNAIPGTALAEGDLGVAGGVEGGVPGGAVGGAVGGLGLRMTPGFALGPGQIAGRLVDETGSAIPGATITLSGPRGQQTSLSGSDGTYRFPPLPSGRYTLTASLSGFASTSRVVNHERGRRLQADFRLTVAGVKETVTVAAETPQIDTRQSATEWSYRPGDQAANAAERGKRKDEAAPQAPSSNVASLQRRVAGVLPVRVDVPRAGASFHFLRPLVIDEETTVRFRYRAR